MHYFTHLPIHFHAFIHLSIFSLKYSYLFLHLRFILFIYLLIFSKLSSYLLLRRGSIFVDMETRINRSAVAEAGENVTAVLEDIVTNAKENLTKVKTTNGHGTEEDSTFESVLSE